MKRRIIGIALLAACSAASAQVQSGSGIGSNTGGTDSVPPRAAPQPLPSSGTSADTANVPATSPRSYSSVGESSATSGSGRVSSQRATGLCDTLIGEELKKCLRELTSTGSAGAGSTGMSGGTGSK
jgi:hypothetical protein